VNFDKALDAGGLSCPLPILKTKKAFANQTGHALLSSTEWNKAFVFHLKKK
jgi:TusA-related sulfurtransferase